jgi:hypothetical protein
MAKSKSTQTTAAAAKKPAAGKPKSTSKGKPVAADAPQIDTALAAQNAAKLVGAKFGGSAGSQAAAGGEARESAAFKTLKQNVNQPQSGSLASVLDKAAGPGQRRPNLPAFGGYQSGRSVSRNQTFGADVNRAGVPRRTGGG